VQPDGEQEQRHPDLCEELYLVYVTDRRAKRVRPDEDAGCDVAEDQGQTEPSGQDASKEGGHQDKRYVAGDPQILVFTLSSSSDGTFRLRWAGRRGPISR
jgi:hypothetical protein